MGGGVKYLLIQSMGYGRGCQIPFNSVYGVWEGVSNTFQFNLCGIGGGGSNSVFISLKYCDIILLKKKQIFATSQQIDSSI